MFCCRFLHGTSGALEAYLEASNRKKKPQPVDGSDVDSDGGLSSDRSLDSDSGGEGAEEKDGEAVGSTHEDGSGSGNGNDGGEEAEAEAKTEEEEEAEGAAMKKPYVAPWDPELQEGETEEERLVRLCRVLNRDELLDMLEFRFTHLLQKDTKPLHLAEVKAEPQGPKKIDGPRRAGAKGQFVDLSEQYIGEAGEFSELCSAAAPFFFVLNHLWVLPVAVLFPFLCCR